MAHFAELNSSNEVLRVIVISNDDVDANGGDQHTDAETFVASIVPYGTGGAAWKQTSFNNNFRKQYAGIGALYNSSLDMFIKEINQETIQGLRCTFLLRYKLKAQGNRQRDPSSTYVYVYIFLLTYALQA